MKSRVAVAVSLLMAMFFLVTLDALPQAKEHGKTGKVAAGREKIEAQPLRLVGAILVPGNPLRFDISWVDAPRARYYLAESGNAGVDVFDAENDLFIGRIPGFH